MLMSVGADEVEGRMTETSGARFGWFGAAAVALLLLLASSLAMADGRLPPVATLDEAKARFSEMKSAKAGVGRFVADRLAAGEPARPGFSGQELRSVLHDERLKWIDDELKALASTEIRDRIPVRLGQYAPEWHMYPVLFGFGWPTSVSVSIPVADREVAAFENGFPGTLDATFRLDERGEVILTGVARGGITRAIRTEAISAGPRLLWQGSHESWITAVAFRPGGLEVLTAGGDGTITCWDAESGNPLYRLKDVEMALSLDYDPAAGQFFVTGAADGFVRLRDGSTGVDLWVVRALGMVFAVAFSPDGKIVAVGDEGGNVTLLDAVTGKEVGSLPLGTTVLSLAFAPDGNDLVIGTEDGAILMWNREARRIVWRKSVEGAVQSVAVSADGGLVSAGGIAPDIVVLDRATGGWKWGVKADGEVRAVRFSPTGRIMAVAGSGYTARLFAEGTGAPLWNADIGNPVRALAFGPAGNRLAVGSSDFSVRVYDVVEGDRLLMAFSKWGRIYVDRAKVSTIFPRQ